MITTNYNLYVDRNNRITKLKYKQGELVEFVSDVNNELTTETFRNWIRAKRIKKLL
jgi:hypothetical protein